MNHLTALADKANYPGTHDKDRYAREVRIELLKVLDTADLSPGEELVLRGCHRLTDRTQPVELTRDRLKVALDLCTTNSLHRWRTDTTFERHGETVTREGALFSSPKVGLELMRRGVITDFDPAVCTCYDQPEAACFAAVHTV